MSEPGRLCGEYVCVLVEEDGELCLHAVLRSGYRGLRLTGFAYDFEEFGRGVALREGARYRVTIEEVTA